MEYVDWKSVYVYDESELIFLSKPGLCVCMRETEQ